MKLDDIEYHPVSGTSKVGGFEVRNRQTASWFKPVMSHGVDRRMYFAFSINLPGEGLTLVGSFCEETQSLYNLPPDCPPDLVERFEQMPAGRRFCRYCLITDFQVDEGPNPALLDADDREAVVSEILFFYNATRMAWNDHNDRKLLRLHLELHARKHAQRVDAAPVPPGLVDFHPSCCPALHARFANRKDGHHVRVV
ncbi:hypothetical protein ACXYMO_16625 [Arenibacterium sp. CAU 1754]